MINMGGSGCPALGLSRYLPCKLFPVSFQLFQCSLCSLILDLKDRHMFLEPSVHSPLSEMSLFQMLHQTSWTSHPTMCSSYTADLP